MSSAMKTGPITGAAARMPARTATTDARVRRRRPRGVSVPGWTGGDVIVGELHGAPDRRQPGDGHGHVRGDEPELPGGAVPGDDHAMSAPARSAFTPPATTRRD